MSASDKPVKSVSATDLALASKSLRACTIASMSASDSLAAFNVSISASFLASSASLAAMTLMLAAEGMGLSTGPMSGFDPLAVSEAFGLDEKDLPVMLITAGYAADENWPQKPRKPVEQVLEIV